LEPRLKDKVRLWFLVPAFLAAYFLISIAYRFSREQLIVDRCLSAYHGSFDYSTMSCDLEANHPYISYQARHPRDKRNFLLALGSLGVFLLAYLSTKTSLKRVTSL